MGEFIATKDEIADPQRYSMAERYDAAGFQHKPVDL